MAGRRVHQLRTYSNCNLGLDPGHPSYGAVLAEEGIHTAYVGKTDVYAPGDSLGFSEVMLAQDRTPPGDTNHRRRPLTIRKGSAALRRIGCPEAEDRRAEAFIARQLAVAESLR